MGSGGSLTLRSPSNMRRRFLIDAFDDVELAMSIVMPSRSRPAFCRFDIDGVDSASMNRVIRTG